MRQDDPMRDVLTRSERRIAERLSEAIKPNAKYDRRSITEHLVSLLDLSPDRVSVVLVVAGCSLRKARRVARLRFLLEQSVYRAGRRRSEIPPYGYMVDVEPLPPAKMFRIPKDGPLAPRDAHLAAHLHACLYSEEYSHAHVNQLDELLAMPWARRRAVMNIAVGDSGKFRKLSRILRYHRRLKRRSIR